MEGDLFKGRKPSGLCNRIEVFRVGYVSSVRMPSKNRLGRLYSGMCLQIWHFKERITIFKEFFVANRAIGPFSRKNILMWKNFSQENLSNSPVLQSARPRAVALASYTGVDKIIKSTVMTVGFARKYIWID